MDVSVPAGFVLFTRKDEFLELIGPLYRKTEPDLPVFGLRADERHINSAGLVHGGVLTAILDVTMGETASAGTARDDFFLTLGLDCQFVAPGRLGDWIEGRAEITRMGKSIAFLSGKLTCEDRVLITGRAIFKPIPRP